MGAAAATAKQLGYLKQLGCTERPSTMLEATKLIDRYRRL